MSDPLVILLAVLAAAIIVAAVSVIIESFRVGR